MKVRRLVRRLLSLCGTALIVIVAYGALLAFPEPLFAHQYAYRNFRIYSRAVLDDRLKAELDVVSQRLATSELNDPAITHRVFVAGSPTWYAFFNGPYRVAMARMYEFNNSVFVPQLDVASGKVVHFDGRTAPIAAILAHEMTHTLSQKKLGIVRLWRLPFWKKEGYAEYVGNPRTVPLAQDLQMLDSVTCNAIPLGNGHEVPRRYFEAALLWRYLADVRKLSLAEIMSDAVVREKAEAEMRAWARQNRVLPEH